jgi:hypothetical protein
MGPAQPSWLTCISFSSPRPFPFVTHDMCFTAVPRSCSSLLHVSQGSQYRWTSYIMPPLLREKRCSPFPLFLKRANAPFHSIYQWR